MKRFLPIFIIAFALVSCENEVDLPTVEKNPIVFGEVETRAAVNDASEIAEFGVFAYMEDGSEAVFEQEKIYWDDEADPAAWKYDNVRYWIPDRSYDFFAFYPYEEDFVTLIEQDGKYIGYSMTFETPAAADVDLMTAHKTVDTNDSYPEFVEVGFKHELVQVNVEVTQDFAKNPANVHAFSVKSMILGNVRKKGTLTSSALGENAVHSWVLDGTVAPMQFSYDDPDYDNHPLNSNGEAAKLSEDHLMLIPQNTGSISLAVTYYYRIKDTETNQWSEWEERTATTNLPSGTWQAGTQVTYSLSLYEVNELVFVKVTVASWGANQSGGTIIIK